jgi:putative FmdB family regulatory protein
LTSAKAILREHGMPTYRYRCTTCGEELEVWQSITDPSLTEHRGVGENADCGGELVKVLSAAGIVLKGSGFYKTDSRSNGKGAKREKTSESGSESKSSDSSKSTGATSDAKSSDAGAASGSGAKKSDTSSSSASSGTS